MERYLIFTLYGPMQSWGGAAVGEVRGCEAQPTRSAVLGLLAACLGLRRDQEDALAALQSGYAWAVRVDAPGQPLTDFHTAQTGAQRKNRVYRTRRDELGGMLGPDEEPGTILSYRDYLQDAAYTVALRALSAAPHPLETLAQALRKPVFTPYLGRKSCPLGLPMRPNVVEAGSLEEALANRQRPAILSSLWSGRREQGQVRLHYVEAMDSTPAERRELRRDRLISRKGWQYGTREELVRHIDAAPSQAASRAAKPKEE